MATPPISRDQDSLQLELHIAAPPERVFQALTDPSQLLHWWGQKGMYHCTSWTTDVRVGGRWHSEGVNDADGSPFHVGGEYLEVDPPRLLAYSWVASWTGPLKTVVRWELTLEAGGTLVRLRHSGFAEAPGAVNSHYQGWVRVTGWMQAYLEDGATVDSRVPAPPAQ